MDLSCKTSQPYLKSPEEHFNNSVDRMAHLCLPVIPFPQSILSLPNKVMNAVVKRCVSMDNERVKTDKENNEKGTI